MNMAEPKTAGALGWQDLREVELLLFREAELADANRYDDWLALWTKDLRYWVPCNSDDLDPARRISLIYDNREQLEDRLFRLGTRTAHAQRPKSRLTRLVGNIVPGADYDPATGGSVESRFVIHEIRREAQTTWSGRSRHVLARVDGALRIREKRVWLLNNDATMGNLTFVV